VKTGEFCRRIPVSLRFTSCFWSGAGASLVHRAGIALLVDWPHENPLVPFKYHSGEEIKKGDRVLFNGEPGEIEFVADALIGDAAMDWYIEEHGGGVMVIEPKCFGRVFLTDTHGEEDLVLVSRILV
jgi:hypothetical protein